MRSSGYLYATTLSVVVFACTLSATVLAQPLSGEAGPLHRAVSAGRLH